MEETKVAIELLKHQDFHLLQKFIHTSFSKNHIFSKENDEWAKETVDLGDIAFWPPGNAICLFFGPTPMSKGDEIRPASATNVMGKIIGDLEELKTINSGDNVKVVLA